MEKLIKLLLIILTCLRQVTSNSEDQRYKVGDHVPLYVNTVGPFQNPRETYRYFDLPFCHPDHLKEKTQTLGDELNGDHFIESPYKLEFRVEKTHEIACRKNLTIEEVSLFRKAIQRDYIFQILCDKDLPFWSSIGRISTKTIGSKHYNKYELFEHKHFEISYNKDRVVNINIRKYPLKFVDITEDIETNVEFFYTVHWKEVDEPFDKRTAKNFPLHSLKYQWITIISACVTLLILIGSLAKVYIRDFENDLIEVLSNEELASDQEERGWKYIRDNVFEFPRQKSLLCAMLGSGAQMLTLTMMITILGLLGKFPHLKQGRLLTALVSISAVTSVVSGYISTSLYFHLEGTNWFKNILLSGCLFIGPLCITFFSVNIIATYYKASVALSFYTVFKLCLIWILVAFPLLLLGGIVGKRKTCKNGNTELRAPLKVTKVSREKIHWRTIFDMLCSGIFSFGSMYSQLPIMMNRIWGLGGFTRYDMSPLLFVIALLDMAVLSAVFTAKQLVRQDPNWWWRSFLRGVSVGLYVYAYCLYYYLAKSKWSGSLQLSFFFGYMACVCYAIFLIFGSVSFAASFLFVRCIYNPIKND